MNQNCSQCPAQQQCWSRFTELNLLACRVRFSEDTESIFRTLLPELKTMIRIVLQKRRVFSMKPEDLYAYVYETLKSFDPSFGLSPLIRLFSQYRGVLVNEIRYEVRLAELHEPLSIAEELPAPEPEPLPDIQHEKTVEDALTRLHDGVTLTTREFRMLYAWLYGSASMVRLSEQMRLVKQDGRLLIQRALRKIQQSPSAKDRFIQDLMEGSVEQAARRLGRKPTDIKRARERLKQGAKPRARVGTALFEAQQKIDIFSGKASEVARILGCSERRVYALRAAQRKSKKHGTRSDRRPT